MQHEIYEPYCTRTQYGNFNTRMESMERMEIATQSHAAHGSCPFLSTDLGGMVLLEDRTAAGDVRTTPCSEMCLAYDRSVVALLERIPPPKTAYTKIFGKKEKTSKL